MLPARQRARRPAEFGTQRLLAGSSIVVPAGTVVYVPGSPSSLPFAGFNACALKATLAGLSGGDSFVIGVDAVDPQSSTGDPLPDGIGRSNVITATTNGAHAGTLYLPAALASGGAIPAQTLLPLANTWQGGWGCNVSDFSVACQTDDGLTSIIQGSDTMPGVGCQIAMQKPTDPGVYTGWSITIVACKLGAGAVIGVDLIIGGRTSYSTPGVGGGVFGDTEDFHWIGYFGAHPPGDTPAQELTTSFQAFVFTLTAAQAQAIALDTNPYLTFQVGTRANTGDPGSPGVTPNITQAFISVPAGGGGGRSSVAIPFFQNLIALDATACTHDITVSALEAELTNA